MKPDPIETTGGGYTRQVLARNSKFEIIQCVWSEGHHSDWHSHGTSQCWVTIQEGVFENQARWAGQTQGQKFEKGETISTPIGAEHALRCLSSRGKTLHVYSPPLARRGDPIFPADPIHSESDLALGDQGLSWSALEQIVQKIQANAVPTHSVKFMNQLFSGIHPEAVLADQLKSLTRTTLATLESSAVLSEIEANTVDALGAAFGWPGTRRAGLSVPGGSSANFMAIHLARQKQHPDWKRTGMQGLHGPAVFVSDQAHYSIRKACMVLGLGTDAVIEVKTDERGQMLPSALQGAIQAARASAKVPLAIIATAGTTVFGAFDPIRALSAIAKAEGLWLHVDGAWGGPAIFSRRLRDRLDGIECADSVAFDAHKLLGASLTCSLFMTRHPDLLISANDVSGADYLFHGDLDRGRYSWQCGRGADALPLWTLWKSRGTAGFEAQIDHLLRIRDELIPWVDAQPRLKWILKPDYLNLCIQVLPPAGSLKDPRQWSADVRTWLRDQNSDWINFSTGVDGVTFLRLILVHPSLRVSDVHSALERALAVHG